MKIEIKPGEYLFNSAGFHICDEKGFAKRAIVDTEVDVTDPSRIEHIQAYQAEARYVAPAPVVEEPSAVDPTEQAPVVEEGH